MPSIQGGIHQTGIRAQRVFLGALTGTDRCTLTTGTSGERFGNPDAVANAQDGVKATAARERRTPDRAVLQCSARCWAHGFAASVTNRLVEFLLNCLH